MNHRSRSQVGEGMTSAIDLWRKRILVVSVSRNFMISISKDTSHPRPLAFQQVGGGMLGKCQRAAMPGEDSAGIKRGKAARHRNEGWETLRGIVEMSRMEAGKVSAKLTSSWVLTESQASSLESQASNSREAPRSQFAQCPVRFPVEVFIAKSCKHDQSPFCFDNHRSNLALPHHQY